MKSFSEYTNEDFKPKNLSGRKEKYDELMKKKRQEFEKLVEPIKLEKTSFLVDLLEYALDKNFKKLGELKTFSFNPDKKVITLYFEESKKELAVNLDLTSLNMNLGTIDWKQGIDDPIFISIKDIE